MKTNSKNYIRGLLSYMSVGFAVGIAAWWVGGHMVAPLLLAIGGGLFYMNRQWIKNVNRSKNGPKIKSIGFQ
ncbi:MAG: hypothetical protein WD824_23125 [Cyclobacteriaceae bacterium]